MAINTSGDTTSSGTVARITLLLRVLAEAEGDASLKDIAERIKLPVSTTHRLLHLLLDQGFVERGHGSRTYRAGLEFLRVGGMVAARAELSETAQTFMQGVVDTCDETCMLSVYVARSLNTMVTRVIYGSHPLRYEAPLYQPSALSWGATGRGILAFLPGEIMDAVLAQGETSPANIRKTAKAPQVRRELAQIRAQGYALTHGQKVPGAVGMSAPVFNAGGVIAALCLTLPESRFNPGMEARFARALMQQAARFTAALGGQVHLPAAKVA
jgi:DNA-binding IclR family transcriptional regulator